MHHPGQTGPGCPSHSSVTAHSSTLQPPGNRMPLQTELYLPPAMCWARLSFPGAGGVLVSLPKLFVFPRVATVLLHTGAAEWECQMLLGYLSQTLLCREGRFSFTSKPQVHGLLEDHWVSQRVITPAPMMCNAYCDCPLNSHAASLLHTAFGMTECLSCRCQPGCPTALPAVGSGIRPERQA